MVARCFLFSVVISSWSVVKKKTSNYILKIPFFDNKGSITRQVEITVEDII